MPGYCICLCCIQKSNSIHQWNVQWQYAINSIFLKRTIVQANYFKEDVWSIFTSINHLEKLVWLAETNETTTERGPGRLWAALCIFTFLLNRVEVGWKSVGLLYSTKTGRGSAGVPVQMELKLSEFLPVADGGRSERQMEKWLPTCLSSSVEPERKPLTEEVTSPVQPGATAFYSVAC